MKIKIGIPFLLLLLLGGTIRSQPATAVQEGSGAKDSVSILRNDIAFNVIPTFQFLSGAYMGGQTRRFSVIYRHLNKHNFYLRYGIVIDRIKTRYSNTTDSTYTLVSQTDSTQIRKFDKGSPSFAKPRLVFGFEKEKGKKKLRQYYGLDISVGAFRYYTTQYFHSYTLNLNNQTNPWVASPVGDVLIQRLDVSALFLGFSPFYGIRYQFTKHFLISAQVGFDMMLDAQTDKIENANHDIIHQPDNRFEANTPGLLSDLSFVYRF
ncbi:MAG: hypothetical protein ACHQRM_07520 [Bacteroidia bacterium]